ncbi:MAG: DNA-binding protein [Actinobacteria bacterium]|nr:DNA-binding protein [Actinomycetota bacterium]MSV86339.1 DNA-binding protein [Actinomycetota bacterium]MSW68022.1 DNA-binding protein [Actinomycetota bacterium]MSX27914.1 DNA-binding protein [Actinomycetota bacterium]MSY03506.1 DNA-binding protein [Actinomycetota bacterium]
MEALAIVPPKLRGWFHLGATPVVFIASLVLFILSHNSLKFAVALYSLTAIALFSVSAIYHRVPWSPSRKKIWRRWDHANINLLIAGSYTPFAVALLEGRDRTILLTVVWVGAIIGVAVRVFWLTAPRWLYVANYLVLGWVAVIYTPALYRAGGLWILIPILIGGLFYSVGAIFYALKFPGKNARYFGFHELFHIFVIAAWVSQYIAISIAIYRR